MTYDGRIMDRRKLTGCCNRDDGHNYHFLSFVEYVVQYGRFDGMRQRSGCHIFLLTVLVLCRVLHRIGILAEN